MASSRTSLTLTFPDRQDWVLGRILEHRAQTHRDKPFLQFMESAPLTYEEVNRRVNQVAHGLSALGLKKGDNILIMLPNSLEFLYIWFAANKLGAVQVPVNTAYKGYFLEHVANTSQARILVVDRNYLNRIEASASNLRFLEKLVVYPSADVAKEQPRLKNLSAFTFRDLYHSDESNPGIAVCEHDLCAIHFTSGTTGSSKGSMMTHAQCYFLADTNVNFVRLTETDVNLTSLPFFHVNAQFISFYSSLLVGAQVVFYPHFSASEWLQQVKVSRATVTTLLGGMMAFVMKQPTTPGDADNDLRAAWAVPCPMELAAQFRHRFAVERTLECYGNTEVGIVTMQSSEDAKPGSCGKVLDEWYDVRIIDSETDEELPPGKIGELVVRPKVPWIITQGYIGMPERTVEAFRNFWFHTGDALKRDENGYFYFVDRIKDRIRRRGENIASSELEQVINAHPAVLESAVVAVKSDIPGGEDEIKAHLTLRPDTTLTPEDLMRWCEERMPYFAVPRYVELMTELPKTPTNKVMKTTLRQRGIGGTTWDREQAGYELKEEINKRKAQGLRKKTRRSATC